MQSENMNDINDKKSNQIPFSIANHGQYFNVILIGNWVVKSPHVHQAKKRLEEIVNIQNELADEIDGILPCEMVEDVIVMPRAPGIRCDNVSYRLWRSEEERIVREAKELGYEITDTSPKNFFWDEDKQQAYFIDFSSVEQIDGP